VRTFAVKHFKLGSSVPFSLHLVPNRIYIVEAGSWDHEL